MMVYRVYRTYPDGVRLRLEDRFTSERQAQAYADKAKLQFPDCEFEVYRRLVLQGAKPLPIPRSIKR